MDAVVRYSRQTSKVLEEGGEKKERGVIIPGVVRVSKKLVEEPRNLGITIITSHSHGASARR